MAISSDSVFHWCYLFLLHIAQSTIIFSNSGGSVLFRNMYGRMYVVAKAIK